MISRSFSGGWMRVVLKNPDTGCLMWRHSNGEYELYEPSGDAVPGITDLREWCLGRAGHLPFGHLQEAQ
jgi:hypothetical protein